MSAERRKFDEEFKKRAVRLSYSSERLVTEIAKSLGISPNRIYHWRKKYIPDGDKTQLAKQQEDLSELRSRIAELEEENYILKKASAFFAKNQK
ncbi:MAG: transposase [Oscillospiraceae bacterium]